MSTKMMPPKALRLIPCRYWAFADEAIVELITIDEIRVAQATDEECREVMVLIDKGVTRHFVLSEHGLITRIAPRDGAKQE